MSGSLSTAFNSKPPKIGRRSHRVYCLFPSKQAQQAFHATKAKRISDSKTKIVNIEQSNSKNVDKLKKQSKNPPILKQEKIEKAVAERSFKEMTVQQKQNCKTCKKILLPPQVATLICEECRITEKIVGNGNLAKFIMFVLEFKRNKISSYKKKSRLNRIGSIESCQSYTLDKPSDSALRHSHFRLKNSIKENMQSIRLKQKLNRQIQNNKKVMDSVKETEKLSSNSNGGYFCNECNICPIKGRRFHCLSCSDYDLCQKCYFYVGHRHQMKTYDDSKEQQIKQLMESTLKKTLVLKNTLPQLTQSIEQLDRVPKLFQTHQLKYQK